MSCNILFNTNISTPCSYGKKRVNSVNSRDSSTREHIRAFYERYKVVTARSQFHDVSAMMIATPTAWTRGDQSSHNEIPRSAGARKPTQASPK